MKKMFVGKEYKGFSFYDSLCHVKEDIVIDEEGYGCFQCLGGSVSTYIVKVGDKDE